MNWLLVLLLLAQVKVVELTGPATCSRGPVAEGLELRTGDRLQLPRHTQGRLELGPSGSLGLEGDTSVRIEAGRVVLERGEVLLVGTGAVECPAGSVRGLGACEVLVAAADNGDCLVFVRSGDAVIATREGQRLQPHPPGRAWHLPRNGAPAVVAAPQPGRE